MGVNDRWLAHWIASQDDANYKKGFFAGIFAVTSLTHVLLVVIASLMFAEGVFRAGNTLHRETLSWLLNAPVSFYEETPSGRITSRFSMDLSQVDMMLGFMMDNCTFNEGSYSYSYFYV